MILGSDVIALLVLVVMFSIFDVIFTYSSATSVISGSMTSLSVISHYANVVYSMCNERDTGAPFMFWPDEPD